MIRTILFDADGVIQHALPFETRLVAALGHRPADVQGFIEEIFRVEQPALRGEAHFPDLLTAVFAQRGLAFDEALFFSGWHQLSVNHEVLEVVATLRMKGLHCALTSNQERVRAA